MVLGAISWDMLQLRYGKARLALLAGYASGDSLKTRDVGDWALAPVLRGVGRSCGNGADSCSIIVHVPQPPQGADHACGASAGFGCAQLS